MPRYVDRPERTRLETVMGHGDVFLDIGANFGLYSLWLAARLDPNVRIEAFEPDPSLCDRLKRNLEFNTLRSITIHQHALGRESSRSFLTTNLKNQGENRLSETKAGVQVDTQTLAEAVERMEIPNIKAAKLDVEGGEFDILDPYFSSVSRSAWPEWLLIEWLKKDPAAPPAIQLATDLGFEIVHRTRMNAILKKRP